MRDDGHVPAITICFDNLAYPRGRCRLRPQTGHMLRGSVAAGSNPDADSARMEKIARIRKAIAEGRYHVSAEDLAEAMIQHLVRDSRKDAEV